MARIWVALVLKVQGSRITNIQQGMSNIQVNIAEFPWKLGIGCWLLDIQFQTLG